MATYTTTADPSGNFSYEFPVAYNAGQKVTVTAEKDAVSKSIELYAPSGVVGGGAIRFSGDLFNFPANIGDVELTSDFTGSIGASAFSGQTAGTWVKSATGLKIGDGVTDIGANAFRAWTASKSLTLGNSVVSIGDYAFEDWSSMDSPIGLPATVKTIGQYAFSASTLTGLSIPTGSVLESIGVNAFANISSLVGELKFPATFKSLGVNAFQDCKPTSIDLSLCSGLTSIPNNAFRLSGATSVKLPPSVSSVCKVDLRHTIRECLSFKPHNSLTV